MLVYGNPTGKELARTLMGIAEHHYGTLIRYRSWDDLRAGRNGSVPTPEEVAHRAKKPFVICGLIFHSFEEAREVFSALGSVYSSRIFYSGEELREVLQNIRRLSAPEYALD